MILDMTEYLGNFLTDPTVPVVLESMDMTVQLCVEICRAKNKTYAFLSPTQCRCDFLPPVNTTITDGTALCSNSALQLCGYSTTVVSAYKIGKKHLRRKVKQNLIKNITKLFLWGFYCIIYFKGKILHEFLFYEYRKCQTLSDIIYQKGRRQ